MGNHDEESSPLKIIDDPFCSMSRRMEALEAILSERTILGIRKSSGEKKIDFHLHSNYSDGFWTPIGLFLAAFRRGMDFISLTDHDCFDGIEEGFEARNLIKRITGKEIAFIPGIEFSTTFSFLGEQMEEVHILGYFPSKNFDEFGLYLTKIDIYSRAYVEAFQKCRVLRIYEMVKKFNEELPPRKGGKLLELSKIAEPISLRTAKRGLRGSVSPGRLLSCTGLYEVFYLNRSGRIDEISDEIFPKAYLAKLNDFIEPRDSPHNLMVKYFGNQQPSAKVGYIGKTEGPKWAVQLIRQMGGIPVLAHPILYPELLEALLKELLPVGLLGVELISSNSAKSDLERIREMDQLVRRSYPDLVVTAGSDCHGHSADGELDYTPNNPMGLSRDFEDLLMKHMDRMTRLFNQGCVGVS